MSSTPKSILTNGVRVTRQNFLRQEGSLAQYVAALIARRDRQQVITHTHAAANLEDGMQVSTTYLFTTGRPRPSHLGTGYSVDRDSRPLTITAADEATAAAWIEATEG